ncbi:ArsR/SmtB family transcription factor [Phytoactinopolyspora limicola]|uniref:ArsR/SmtB family transcription factor n=1 Tax=Phytoactinopolyspora limicola TaxID=2715536 RepID=UPI00140D01DD|nr:helix-turn-helix domain-containing protein [Phytoactinopolyspora limicola]
MTTTHAPSRDIPGVPGTVFTAMADDVRRDLLQTLIHDGAATASQLARSRPISRQAIGKHLEVLSQAALVQPRKVGREVQYVPQVQTLRDTSRWLTTLARQWDRRLDRLARLAESDPAHDRTTNG